MQRVLLLLFSKNMCVLYCIYIWIYMAFSWFLYRSQSVWGAQTNRRAKLLCFFFHPSFSFMAHHLQLGLVITIPARDQRLMVARYRLIALTCMQPFFFLISLKKKHILYIDHRSLSSRFYTDERTDWTLIRRAHNSRIQHGCVRVVIRPPPIVWALFVVLGLIWWRTTSFSFTVSSIKTVLNQL